MHDNGERRKESKMGGWKVPTMGGCKLMAPNRRVFLKC